MDDASRFALLDSLPQQDHHIATNKNQKWTPLFQQVLAQHFPGKTLKDGWNVVPRMKHEPKKHLPAYHYWVYRNLEKALRESNGNWTTFDALWKTWVKDVITGDPTIVRREFWDC